MSNSPNTFLFGRFLFTLLLATTFLSWGALEAQSQVRSLNTASIDEAVRREMSSQRIVGAAVGVIRDGRLVYSSGYGFANKQAGRMVSTKTVFNWASNSKPFIAVAALQLVEKGQLNLDAPIGSYIPSLPAVMKPITTRQLLCHQSGIPHYSNGRIISSGTRHSPQAELNPMNSIDRFIKSPLIFKPGAKSDYSSYAYVLLSAVVQQAGGQSIDQQLRSRIVNPLRLDSFQLDVAFRGQRDWTTGYRIQGGRPVPVNDYAHAWKHGAGAYKSNVNDFAKFAIALMSSRLISGRTTQMMWTPQKTTSGQTTSRGLGVYVNGSGDNLKISHNGSQDETRTRMVFYPRQRHGIVVMSNTAGSDPGRISTAIYRAINSR